MCLFTSQPKTQKTRQSPAHHIGAKVGSEPGNALLEALAHVAESQSCARQALAMPLLMDLARIGATAKDGNCRLALTRQVDERAFQRLPEPESRRVVLGTWPQSVMVVRAFIQRTTSSCGTSGRGPFRRRLNLDRNWRTAAYRPAHLPGARGRNRTGTPLGT